MIISNYTIYSLINLDNGKRYIGRTEKLKARIQGHLSALKSHRHHNPYLNEDADCRFIYEVLETDIQGLPAGRKAEQSYMIKFKTYDPQYGYNVNDWGMKHYRRELQVN